MYSWELGRASAKVRLLGVLTVVRATKWCCVVRTYYSGWIHTKPKTNMAARFNSWENKNDFLIEPSGFTHAHGTEYTLLRECTCIYSQRGQLTFAWPFSTSSHERNPDTGPTIKMISSLISTFVSASAAPHNCSCFLAMPSLSSSPRAPKGQMKLTTTAVILLTLLSVLLLASSCQARGLRAHGNKGSSSKSHLPKGKKVSFTVHR
jgi:hypothetical protein